MRSTNAGATGARSRSLPKWNGADVPTGVVRVLAGTPLHQLNAALAAIGQMSTSIAHELNQPLAALRTLSGNTVRFLERGALDTASANLKTINELIDGWIAQTPPGFIAADVTGRRVQNWIYSLHATLLDATRPADVADVLAPGDMVIAVCDNAHEEMRENPNSLHWSIPDPARTGSAAAFDRAFDDIDHRVARLAPHCLPNGELS